MKGLLKRRILTTTILAVITLNSLDARVQIDSSGATLLLSSNHAEARTSGGRSRGGSFSRPSRSSGGSRPSVRPPSSTQPYSDPYRRPYSSAPVIVPVPGGYSSPASGGSSPLGLLIFLCLFLVLPIGMMYLSRSGRGIGRSSGATGVGELQNNIVTVTRLQVALLAQARSIQEALTQLTEHANLETPEGLVAMLQETVLALLRSPENWTHAQASSQTVNSREEAAQLFENLSIAERSKFDTESLVRTGKQVRRQAIDPGNEPGEYIVVTLLIGTEDDRPLISSPIHSVAELQAVLQRLGSITPHYLLIYELLWSPQVASDSLTYEELLTEYPGLYQL